MLLVIVQPVQGIGEIHHVRPASRKLPQAIHLRNRKPLSGSVMVSYRRDSVQRPGATVMTAPAEWAVITGAYCDWAVAMPSEHSPALPAKQS